MEERLDAEEIWDEKNADTLWRRSGQHKCPKNKNQNTARLGRPSMRLGCCRRRRTATRTSQEVPESDAPAHGGCIDNYCVPVSGLSEAMMDGCPSPVRTSHVERTRRSSGSAVAGRWCIALNPTYLLKDEEWRVASRLRLGLAISTDGRGAVAR